MKDNIFAIIERNKSQSYFIGPISDALITRAETHLNVSFPPSYREFLSRLGAGSFGAFEVYGIIGDDLLRKGVPNMVWITSIMRKDRELPHGFVVIGDSGDDAYYAIDTSRRLANNESPVVCFWPGSRESAANPHVESKTFHDFLARGISAQLE